ncbi:putative gibberellin regulated protein [Medicago truncatula]|uniref:Putative gibberellin regulated protein n=1 Tax=Medicago truncatula TaxID=3880 RepID=A0A396HTC8_MEDTR|nr:putative gibberellin regulated protein [Medicago truncatula]
MLSQLKYFFSADCAGACDVRCSATMYKKACLTYCNYCCAKCLCVPSGTYGHKEECPCYANMRTKRGGPKCP